VGGEGGNLTAGQRKFVFMKFKLHFICKTLATYKATTTVFEVIFLLHAVGFS